MAEIHALLYTSSVPLCTDDIMEQLAVSRGSASMNLRQLLNWGLIYRAHIRGDRKEYFTSEHDVWQMFETITRERRRREVQPIMETVERCLSMIAPELEAATGDEAGRVRQYKERLDNMLEFLVTMSKLFNYVVSAGGKEVGRMTQAITRLIQG